MLRTVAIVAALLALALPPARACTGQVGKVIFQDNFADDSGGWDQAPPVAVIQPPVFAIALDAQYNGVAAQNLTFNATDGDYCMDFILPPAIAPNNQMYAGIEFWATDYSNTSLVLVASNAAVTLAKEVAGNWSDILTYQNAPGFNYAANAVNSLRVTALSGIVTIYLNGTAVKAVKMQEPTNPKLSFGLYGQDDTAVSNTPVIQIKNFSVTAGK